CDVLHHGERPEDLLREGARVARHTVLIKDHAAEGFLARPTLRFMDIVGNVPHGVHVPANYLTCAEWTRAWRECGLEAREVRRQLGLYPWWAEPFFGRSLHFIASLDVGAGGDE
ncbi:MAG TPA: hypothetical protein VK911_15805, partial [Vicinamibacterales bacterium]|nr:hypothetical protein [Vicinamibacterales bacterium]